MVRSVMLLSLANLKSIRLLVIFCLINFCQFAIFMSKESLILQGGTFAV